MRTTRRLFLLAGAAAFFGACSRHSPPGRVEASSPPARVQVAAVRREAMPILLETSGTVRAVRRAALAAKIAGPIEILTVRLGQPVRAGEVLVQISSAEYAARGAQARAQFAQVERELARERALQATGAGPLDAVRALEDRLVQTQAAVREAETMLGYTSVRAPFAGVVAAKHAEAGDFAIAGVPLLQLDGSDAFEIEIGLPESAGQAVAVAAGLDVEIPVTGARFRATVTELSSAADPVARTTTARLAIPASAAVRPGQFARVLLPAGTTPVLLVPATAVSTFGQMERVFVVDAQGRANLRLVKTGSARGENIEIVSGLDVADRVVVAPPTTLHDGQALDPAP